MKGQFLTWFDTTYITKEIFSTGKLEIRPYAYYAARPFNEIQNFMLENGIYVLPTTEMIDWLKGQIIGTAIEIGAGNGAIGRALGIPITDSHQQATAEAIAYYTAIKQPPIKYPADVEKLTAYQAIKKYEPDTVIGAFITHRWNGVSGNAYGPREEQIIENTERYIMIGNYGVHNNKPIIQEWEHNAFTAPWIITRAVDQSLNRIFIF